MEKFLRNGRDRIILLFVMLAASICVFFFMPWFNLHPIPCIHREITGIGCPLCGMTHATYEMLHLRFKAAFYYNPAIPFMAIWFGMECLALINSSQRIGSAVWRLRSAKALRKVSFIIFLAALGVVYALRIMHLI